MARSIRSGGATKARVSPAVARQIDSQVDRLLTLLRERIRATRHTQEQIQTKLGWGRSYISQILTRQKTVRFDQLFAILQVIGVEPEDFFADLGWKGAKSVGFKPASIADVGQGHDELAKLLLLFETLSVTLPLCQGSCRPTHSMIPGGTETTTYELITTLQPPGRGARGRHRADAA